MFFTNSKGMNASDSSSPVTSAGVKPPYGAQYTNYIARRMRDAMVRVVLPILYAAVTATFDLTSRKIRSKARQVLAGTGGTELVHKILLEV